MVSFVQEDNLGGSKDGKGHPSLLGTNAQKANKVLLGKRNQTNEF